MDKSGSAFLPRILFFNVNGSGMGHLNRCLAYARQLREQVCPVFFSLSSAIEIIEEMGFKADYFVSHNWSRASSSEWNRELCLRLGLMLERVRPAAVVFDGTWPYQGFIHACREYGKAKIIWSYRGLHQADKIKPFLYPDMFSMIIRPGEVGDEFGFEDGDFGCPQVRVPPVCVLKDDELLDKVQAREAMGLSENGRYALFSLGAGNINDVEGVGVGLIQQLQNAGFEVIWANNPISVKDVVLPEGVRPVSAYPLVRYLRAFDVFIGASGYNTCCEIVQAQVPALLVPNTDTKLDDQNRRAYLVARHAPIIVSRCGNESEREASVRELLQLAGMHIDRKYLVPMNGAALAADTILALANR